MKNEAIVAVCGDIALKFLEITLPQNIQFFDNYIIISDSKSKDVHEFCKNWPVTLLITDSFYLDGCKFNRGRCYNESFSLLDYRQRVSLLDTDCFISDKLGNEIRNTDYNVEIMWGARRCVVPKLKDLTELLKGNQEFEDSLKSWPGFCYGFCQVFDCNAQSIKQNGLVYPGSQDCSCEDWIFRNSRFGETVNEDNHYIGNIRPYKNKIWHLGEPNISGGKNFFIP